MVFCAFAATAAKPEEGTAADSTCTQAHAHRHTEYMYGMAQ